MGKERDSGGDICTDVDEAENPEPSPAPLKSALSSELVPLPETLQ